MTKESGEASQELAFTIEDWLEFVPSILMAVAVVLTAYSAYESARWGGVQATDFATASSLRIEASAATTVGVTQMSYDAGTFGQLALEFRDTDFSDPVQLEQASQLANSLMRDEFKVYFEEWVALDPSNNDEAPGTPFDLPGFSNDKIEDAERLTAAAEVSFNEAKDANQTSDDYILATIFFASVLFFTGLRMRNVRVRSFVTVLAAFALVSGIVRISTLPFQ